MISTYAMVNLTSLVSKFNENIPGFPRVGTPRHHPLPTQRKSWRYGICVENADLRGVLGSEWNEGSRVTQLEIPGGQLKKNTYTP